MKVHYIANITAGALLIPKSRKIADLMMKVFCEQRNMLDIVPKQIEYNKIWK